MLALHRVAHQHVMIKLRVKYGHGRDVLNKQKQEWISRKLSVTLMPQTAKTHDRKEKK